jgi:hypothetical protein
MLQLAHKSRTLNPPASLTMKPPLIVNESSSIDRTGDLYVFNTVAGLESYLEPWYVNESHFIFDSNGMQLVIMANGNRVRLDPKEPRSFNVEVAHSYFAAFLKAFGIGVTDDFVKSATLSELAEASAKFADD